MRVVALVLAAAIGADGHVQGDIRAGRVPSRGVNLGGWLVAEYWMTTSSSIWNGVPADRAAQGEYHAMSVLGHSAGDAAFESHRRSFITQADIAQVGAAGLNTVRVPVGYWIRGCGMLTGALFQQCSVFAPGGLKYLDMLIQQWARAADVAVLISIHGAPGSQNGNDHSAAVVKGKVDWPNDPINVKVTRDLVLFLVDRYKNEPAFLGVGLLNEPDGQMNSNVLFSYYMASYNDVRSVSDCILTMMPRLYNQYAGNGDAMGDFGKTMQNVWIEWHPYLIWGYESYSEAMLLNQGINSIANNIANWRGHPLYFGEWSIVTPASTFSNPDALASFRRQLVPVMNAAQGGWAYWTWRADGDGNGNKWSLRDLLRRMQYPIVRTAANAVGSSPPLSVLQSNGVGLSLLTQTQSLAADPAWIAAMGPLVAERWSYNPSTQQLQSLTNGNCLDAYFDNGLQRNVIHGYSCDGSNANQKWQLVNHQLVNKGLCLALVDAAINTDLVGNRRLVACDTASTAQFFTLGIEVARLRIASLASLVLTAGLTFQSPLARDTSQLWLFNHLDYTVMNQGSGQCLDAYEAKVGGAVHLYECVPGNVNQLWRYNPQTRQLQHMGHAGYCLDVYGPPHLNTCYAMGDPAMWAQALQLEWISFPALTGGYAAVQSS
ncbi:hypothetical protein SDRG_07907 [Saprolegnia diclina VS20]|uniref:glucan 1,3-beta-glucosidase n=1 Tax=Saprolegnia diclina (strain VS20) TaxID=1156394 RepID=T0RW84_SAPDV|nr:hypothetical protein SDRG_07907 [Saprolegnia diclina VS20]EQC34582.1 hypothetical protein SDRG_07907 [Saprolegnia diclina VS20]|eukprot:XP_008611988.1 hypothetical protein SDRG_07907 [Saprolegnia diclina VS20]